MVKNPDFIGTDISKDNCLMSVVLPRNPCIWHKLRSTWHRPCHKHSCSQILYFQPNTVYSAKYSISSQMLFSREIVGLASIYLVASNPLPHGSVQSILIHTVMVPHFHFPWFVLITSRVFLMLKTITFPIQFLLHWPTGPIQTISRN